MIILDTDHLSILQHPESSRYHTLIVRMSSAADREFVAAAISVEEEFRGWLAAIHRAQDAHGQILYYSRLVGLVRFFSNWQILPFNEPAADRFASLRNRA